jgi:hypothetical protein
VYVDAKNNKDLKPAGMGRGLGKLIDDKTRGDYTTWLAPLKNTTKETLAKKKGASILLGAMDILKQQLMSHTPPNEPNQSEMSASSSRMILKRLSHQLARYPGNETGYVRHRDAYPSEDGSGRWLTALYYFNQGSQLFFG